MKESKIAKILSAFSKDELKSFKKFTESDIFKSRRFLGNFLNLLSKYHPGFEISHQQFFNSLYPGEPYNERKMKNLSSELVRLAEQFLAISRLKKSGNEFEKFLAEEYHERSLEGLFYNSIKTLEKKVYLKPFDSVQCYNEEEKIERMRETFFADRNRFKKSISAKLTYTEQFTISFLIRYLRSLRDRKIIALYNVPFDSPLLSGIIECLDFDRLLELLKEKQYRYYWLIRIYYYVYKSTAEEGSEPYFKELKKDIYENLEKFSENERYFLFNDLVDYCRRQEYLGNLSYRAEEFEIYKAMLEREAYSGSKSEPMSVVLFRNIVLLACSLAEYRWLEEFIENYHTKLRDDYSLGVKFYALANLHFEEGRFEAALEKISKVKPDFVLFKTDIRSLQLRIYYELSLYEQAYFQIDAFRHFLTENDEMSSTHKRRFFNFLRIYVKLLRAKESRRKKDIALAEMRVAKEKNVSWRSWLEAKTKELTESKRS